MSHFEIKLRTLTPTFCRGKDAASAEIRPPSLKGQLRWWYRAWQPLAVNGPPDGPWSEGMVMGGTRGHAGQCPFTLRIAQDLFNTISWREVERTAPRGSRSQVGGIRYLGFAFRTTRQGPEDHRAVPPDVGFTATHVFPRGTSDEAARGLIAAWWLLAHLGGLGARGRRGFGSVTIEAWEWPDRQDLLRSLPLPGQARDGRTWQAMVIEGLQVLERWLDRDARWPRGYPHPHLGPGSEVVLFADPAWRRHADALEAAGQTLATGRRDHRGPPGPVDGRVTVGLPLETGRRPTRSWRPGSWQTHRIETDRHASALHLSVGAYKAGSGTCWTRLAGPVPGIGGYRVWEERDKRQTIPEEAHDTLTALVRSLPGRRWTPGGAR